MQNNYKRKRSYRVQLNKSDSESDCEPRTQNKVIKAIKGEINCTRPQTRYINSPLNIQFPICLRRASCATLVFGFLLGGIYNNFKIKLQFFYNSKFLFTCTKKIVLYLY